MTLESRIQIVQNIIHAAEAHANRSPNSVKLLAVSKGVDINDIKQAFACGIRDFGESYLQEAEQKIAVLQDYPITWHFIGPIQRNKAKKISQIFDWVHSVARQDIALALNHYHPIEKNPLNICLQLKLATEPQKSGLAPEDVPPFIESILTLSHLRLRGLMLIPKQDLSTEELQNNFLYLQDLLKTLNYQKHLNMDTLSMGMSQDYQMAIYAGSTIVRIGRAIFRG